MTALSSAPQGAGPATAGFKSGSARSSTPLIYLLEDDPIMAECLALSCRRAPSSPTIKVFADAISAMADFDHGLPDLILLDIMLNGPNGFTFLNELMSYSDTSAIPIILITSLELRARSLEHHGVREILSKETLTPAGLTAIVGRYV